MTSTKLYEGTPGGKGFPLGIIAAADFREGDDRKGLYVAEDEGHRLIVGPPGTGKFTSAIAPLLLSNDQESIIVFDVKDGEAARVTAAHRAKLGDVLVLDPFGISGQPSASINPLDALKVNDGALLSNARRLADAIMLFATGDGTSDYFNGQAKNFLVVLLIHVATSPDEEGQRTLRRVRQIIRRPFTPPAEKDKEAFDDSFTGPQEWANAAVFYSMLANRCADDIVRDEAENMLAEEGRKNAFYVQQTLRENTAFLDLPEVQQVTASTSTDLRKLRRSVGTLYVVVPEAEIDNVARWMRILYSLIIDQVKPGNASRDAVRVHVILDEFPSLGRFDRVPRDMAVVRSYGINMHVVV